MGDSRFSTDGLRAIPAMDRLLRDPALAPLLERWGREPVKEAVRAHLAGLRALPEGRAFDIDRLVIELGEALPCSMRSTLRRVINATGVIIHTNLGRSPISTVAWAGAESTVSHYSNLEFDLAAGARGARHLHVSALAARLFGCEAAILVNNNAAAVLLVLSAIAARKDVIVSRGELVEIGGGFRVPDVIEQGGARLVEVGTTNKTRAKDFAEAIGRRTGAILRVHQSNFQIVGFTEEPSVEELAAIARKKRIPFVIDEGSGRVVDLSRYGLRAEPTVRQLFESGADVVTCSTDKLIGSVQGGMILGSKAIIEACAKHPLMRALRPGKESVALVGEALSTFLSGTQERDIPIYRMLSTTVSELRRRAEALAATTGGSVVVTESTLGGGTTPQETIPSVALSVPGNPDTLQRALLDRAVPIVGRITDDRLLFDLRTVDPSEDDEIARGLEEIA